MNKHPRQKLPKQSPGIRTKNFQEVALGFAEEQTWQEASRCLECKKATCVAGCPVEIDIPAFIKKIKEKDFAGAIKAIKEKNSLPAVCGRVCPQETQCEQVCVLAKKYEPVAIGYLERFVADWEQVNSPKSNVQSPMSGKVADPGSRAFVSDPEFTPLKAGASRRNDSGSVKVAVIGSGPGGLTCAADLAKIGYQVTIFEALHKAGGVLVYGIPEFRLPKAIVEREVDFVKSLGVEIKLNYVIGQSRTLDELFSLGYQAIFIATGAGLPKFMNIPGENLNGVYSANEFLTRSNLMKAYLFPEYDTPLNRVKRVAVIGGGNVAMDSARTALRLGAEKVYILYRRSLKEMPARKEEIENAQEEGIEFHFLIVPVKIWGDDNGWVKQIECVRTELGEPDASGRRRPVVIKDSNFRLDVDTVIVAVGTSANPLLSQTTPELKLNQWGYIEVDQTGKTSKEGVWAGGDIVTGSATVIEAMGAGKRAARAIDEYLRKNK